MNTEARQRFAALAAQPDASVDLSRAALLIAAERDGDLDLDAHLAECEDRFATLARGARQHQPGDDRARLESLLHYLGRRCHFRGNQDDYYDLRNSYLDEVLNRHTGIPITLALVYIEVGKRIGIDIRGVSFPGHFLALHPASPPVLFDPFSATVIDEKQCRDRLRAAISPEAELEPGMLDPAPNKEILARILTNLKLIHVRSSAFDAALACSERILLLHPDQPSELRDRAALYIKLQCYDAARTDMSRFLEIAPNHPDTTAIRETLLRLQSGKPTLH